MINLLNSVMTVHDRHGPSNRDARCISLPEKIVQQIKLASSLTRGDCGLKTKLADAMVRDGKQPIVKHETWQNLGKEILHIRGAYTGCVSKNLADII